MGRGESVINVTLLQALFQTLHHQVIRPIHRAFPWATCLQHDPSVQCPHPRCIRTHDAFPRYCSILRRPIKLTRESKTTQRLAEVRLRSTLLLRRQRGSRLGQIGVCGLDERLDGRYDAGRGLALEGLGLEGLDNEGEDLCGLGEDGLVLSVGVLAADSPWE
jgi:hypothetical protein